MNKIYKTVWNKTLGQVVVASELASGRGAASARTTPATWIEMTGGLACFGACCCVCARRDAV